MFHFPRYAQLTSYVSVSLTFSQRGFPIRTSPDRRLLHTSPKLIAATSRPSSLLCVKASAIRPYSLRRSGTIRKKPATQKLILNGTILVIPSFLIFLSGSSGKSLFSNFCRHFQRLKNRPLQAVSSTQRKSPSISRLMFLAIFSSTGKLYWKVQLCVKHSSTPWHKRSNRRYSKRQNTQTGCRRYPRTQYTNRLQGNLRYILHPPRIQVFLCRFQHR